MVALLARQLPSPPPADLHMAAGSGTAAPLPP
jgi:hypothetical protein